MQSNEPSFIVRLLSKYNYPTKFIFISALFLFSILVSNYFMIREQNEKIRFTELELMGTKYEANLRRLLESIIKHQLLSNKFIQGDNNLKSDLSNTQQQVSSDFTNIKVLDAEFEDDLRTSATEFQLREKAFLRPAELEAKWNELARASGDLKLENSNAMHDRILKDLVSLISYINDYSNLYLDPHIEATYLGDSAYLAIPQIEIIIPKIIIALESMTASAEKKMSLEDRVNIASMIAALEIHLKDARESYEKVFVETKQSNENVEVEAKVKEPMNVFLNNLQEFISYVRKNYLLSEELVDRQFELSSMGNKTINSGFTLWDTTNEEIIVILEKRISKYRFQQLFALLTSLLCAAIGFTLGFIVMREISKPLLNLLTAAKQLASGDLSVRIPVQIQDEVGQVGSAFNQMVDALHELIGRLQWTGIQLTTSTTQISAAAKEQEATVVQQEATTKQIAVTAKEISATAKDFAMTMNGISNTAEQTSALASSVKSGLVKMEAIMRQMVEASSNIASKLAVLNEKAANITTVITTITKVADQTNLLSLNAAIEAEKAGEHGRSFAVIAREIRRLADQTANATLDIEKMVNEIVSAVSAGVMGVDKFSEEIHTGVNQVSVVSEQLGEIIEQVQQVTESFESVNQGMQAQSIGAEQINESIGQLSDAAQQTTESIRQFHNAIDQLNNAAQEMQTAVSKIKR